MLTLQDYKDELDQLCRKTSEMNGMERDEYDKETFLRIMKADYINPTPVQTLFANTRRRYILLNPVDYQNFTPDAIYSSSTLYLLIDYDEQLERRALRK